MRGQSFVDQCIDDVHNLKKISTTLLEMSSIEKFKNDTNSGIAIVAPPYYWGKLTPEGEIVQANAINLLDELVTRLDLLFDGKPSTILDRFQKVKEYFNNLIKRDKTNWAIPSSVDEAKKELENEVAEMTSLLEWMKNLENKEIIIIPDTNGLIINNRMELYGQLLDYDVEKWTVIVTSTVLKELDELKIKNTGKDFKEKIKKTINYLKGLRNQGDALKGIQLFCNQVTFKLQAIEPNMDKTLPWLDSNNNDDRIIATCFDLQISNPASCVILMTADLNLQTKAQMAKLPFIEPNQLD